MDGDCDGDGDGDDNSDGNSNKGNGEGDKGDNEGDNEGVGYEYDGEQSDNRGRDDSKRQRRQHAGTQQSTTIN